MATGTRTAKVELKTSAAGVDPGLKDARRKLRAFEREQLKYSRQAVRAVAREQDRHRKDQIKRAKGGLGFLKGAVVGAGAAAGFDIAGGVGSMVQDLFAVEKELTRFGIDSNMTASDLAAFRAQVAEVSNATGVSRLELAKAAHQYQAISGDADGARSSVKLFADVANASGASLEDIATAAASMKQNLGLDPKDFRKGFDVFLTMGHQGAVELRDFAAEMSGIAPQFKDFGTKMPADKLAEMAASAQVIRNNFGDASEMATGFRSLMTAVTKKQSKLAKYGVNVFKTDPKTKKLVKRDFLDIVGDIIKNPKLNDKILPKLLGRDEAVRALTAFRDHWQEIQQLTEEAANSDQVSVDSQKWMASASGRIAVAWERIKNGIASALTPERIDHFASALVSAANAFVKAMGVAEEVWAMVHGENTKQEQGIHEWNRRLNHNQNREAAGDNNKSAAISDIEREDQLRNRLEAQSYGVDWTKAGDVEKYGKLNGRSSIYSKEEIRGISATGGGASNWQSGLATALVAAFRKAPLHVVVKADANAIAGTGSNAHVHSTRPGGRR